MTQQQIDLLTQKIADQTISDEELQQYYSWLSSDDQQPLEVNSAASKEELQKRIYLNIANKANFNLIQPKQTKLWPKIAVIAAAVTAIIIGAYFFSYNTKTVNNQTFAKTNDVAPGTVGATLTLASGKKIRLADAKDGELAKEAGVVITKTQDGKLVYEIQTSTEEHKINTISTAMGETYQLRLPDGSQVYLNAASSLTYSANLKSHGKREVTLDGEAYFEISKDKERPFQVKTNGQTIEVLGTHFNVNAYTDEKAIKTTLIEGLVKVSTENSEKIIKPGEQAIKNENSNNISVAKVDTENITDWKDNDFNFNGDDLQSAMRKISRWYNVEIVYADNLPKNINPGGWISRNNNISAVLKMIEASGLVHFKIEGRRISVSK